MKDWDGQDLVDRHGSAGESREYLGFSGISLDRVKEEWLNS